MSFRTIADSAVFLHVRICARSGVFFALSCSLAPDNRSIRHRQPGCPFETGAVHDAGNKESGDVGKVTVKALSEELVPGSSPTLHSSSYRMQSASRPSLPWRRLRVSSSALGG